MKTTILCLFASFLCLTNCKEHNKIQAINNTKEAENTSVYYLIRHAEKDLSNPSNKNPRLTEAGHLRAKKWATLFKDVSFDAVYSTNFHRTRKTALPIAQKNNLKLKIYDPFALDIKAFLKQTKGQHILIVGHSDTTPSLANKLLGKEKYDAIDEANYANYYIITIEDGIASGTLLKMP